MGDLIRKVFGSDPPRNAEPVGAFGVTEVSCGVEFEGSFYHVRAFEIDFLQHGLASFAMVSIREGARWHMVSSGKLMLTHSGGNHSHECEDQMIGDFAGRGMMVKRELVSACLFPVGERLLELERDLKTF